jgi:hypothetical protein
MAKQAEGNRTEVGRRIRTRLCVGSIENEMRKIT